MLMGALQLGHKNALGPTISRRIFMVFWQAGQSAKIQFRLFGGGLGACKSGSWADGGSSAIPGKVFAATGKMLENLGGIYSLRRILAGIKPKVTLEIPRRNQNGFRNFTHFMDYSATLLTPSGYLLLSIFAFLLGACIGSFLNVVIYRVPRNLSVSKPRRSFCPNCQQQIAFWHNIPLLSWLLLRGKCHSCAKPISPRYLGVELLTAVLFVLVFRLTWNTDGGNPYLTAPYWLLMALFVAGTFIDIEHYILPDSITLGGTAAGLLAAYFVPEFFLHDQRWPISQWFPEMASSWQCLLTAVFGAIFGYLSLWLIVILGKILFGRKKHKFESPTAWKLSQASPETEPVFRLGEDDNLWGDMFSSPRDRLILSCPQASINGEEFSPSTLTIQEKGVQIQRPDGSKREIPLEQLQLLEGTCTEVVIPREAMGMGDVKFMALVGAFLGWQGVLFTIFLGSVSGAAISILLILFRRREWAQRVPFGPYLALGATIFLFLGTPLIDWWLERTQQNGVENHVEEVIPSLQSGL